MKTVTTHYISFIGCRTVEPRSIRIEFAIPARNKQEAKTIAEREVARLQGYRYLGSD
ncbi:MAG: hypothetical protein PHC88_05435 [Terrimicrobiaceae bacterium]|nr:hypothetical protein [Terrimicrobiaceae bacterium]